MEHKYETESGRKSIPNFLKDFYMSKELFGRLVYGGDGILNLRFFTKQGNWFTNVFFGQRVCGCREVLLLHFVENAKVSCA